MRLPDRMRARSLHDRRRIKDRIRREFEHKRHTLGPRVPYGRKPATLLIALGVLSVAGALLLGRTTLRFPAYDRAAKPLGLRATNEVQVLRIALERYRADCGHYPTAREGLRALVRNPDRIGWKGPYITLLKPDPWGTEYLYARHADGRMDLRSAGPDRTGGTADDIVPPIPTPAEIARVGGKAKVEGGSEQKWKEGGGEGDGDGGMLSV
jgi:general secretion pathway protein G